MRNLSPGQAEMKGPRNGCHIVTVSSDPKWTETNKNKNKQTMFLRQVRLRLIARS
jgi:hypothetical protein